MTSLKNKRQDITFFFIQANKLDFLVLQQKKKSDPIQILLNTLNEERERDRHQYKDIPERLVVKDQNIWDQMILFVSFWQELW